MEPRAQQPAERGRRSRSRKPTTAKRTVVGPDCDFVVTVRETIKGRYRSVRDALKAAKRIGLQAEVWMRDVVRIRTLDYATQTLTFPDHARGPRNVLRGQTTKVLKHRVFDGIEWVRVY